MTPVVESSDTPSGRSGVTLYTPTSPSTLGRRQKYRSIGKSQTALLPQKPMRLLSASEWYFRLHGGTCRISKVSLAVTDPRSFLASTVQVVSDMTSRGTPQMVPRSGSSRRLGGSAGLTDHLTTVPLTFGTKATGCPMKYARSVV